jgi:thiol-disulfide isomerase/thioredoxin
MVRWILVLLMFIFGAEPALAADPVRSLKVGDILPDVPLTGLNGPSSRTSAFRGKPLIINVWASWCGPCRQEMASLERLAWQDTGRFSVIGISTDDYAGKARAFLALSHATVAHYIDVQLALEHLLGADRLPLTVLVDADGRVLEKVYGARVWDGEPAVAFVERLFGLAP